MLANSAICWQWIYFNLFFVLSQDMLWSWLNQIQDVLKDTQVLGNTCLVSFILILHWGAIKLSFALFTYAGVWVAVHTLRGWSLQLCIGCCLKIAPNWEFLKTGHCWVTGWSRAMLLVFYLCVFHFSWKWVIQYTACGFKSNITIIIEIAWPCLV